MPITINVNGQDQTIDASPDTPLLWALRDHLNLTGSKFGCGIAQCGACTVHINGQAARSCVTPLATVKNAKITTIEGLDSREAKAVQEAWNKLDVVQCGYCQSGQIMSAVSLLSQSPQPSDEEINNAMSGNICRCSTYVRIKAAIELAASALGGAKA